MLVSEAGRLRPCRGGSAERWGADARWRSSRKNFPTRRVALRFLSARRWPDGFVCPGCGRATRSGLEEPSAPVGMPRLRTAAPRSLAGTAMHRSKLPLTTWFWAAHVMAHAFQRHVRATIGGPTRRHLQDGLAFGAEASALDGRSQPRSSRRGCRGGPDGASFPRRRRVLRARRRRQNPASPARSR